MVDFVALVTPPKLVGPDMKPANGDIYVRSTNSISKSGVIVVPFQVHGKIVEGEFQALDGGPLMLVVTPEGVALEIFADIFQDSRVRKDKHTISRTVSTPNQSTVTWDALTDVVPVESGSDYVIPSWAQDLDAKADEAIAASDVAVMAAAGAESSRDAAATAAAAAQAVGTTNDTVIAGRINDSSSATATALAVTIETQTFVVDTDYASLESALAAVAAGGVLEVRGAWSRTLPWTVNKTCAVRFAHGGSITTAVASISAIIVAANGVTLESPRLIGTGGGASSSGKAIVASGTVANYIQGLRVTNPHLSDFSEYGIYLEFCSDFRITNVNIANIAYAGITMASCSNGVIDGGAIRNITQAGLTNSYGVTASRRSNSASELAAFPRSKNITVQNVLIDGVAGWTGLDTHGGDGISFINNTLRNCLVGIGVVASSNNAAASTYAPINAYVMGNKIYGKGDGTDSAGIWFIGCAAESATGMVIANTVEDMGGDTATAGNNWGAVVVEQTRGALVAQNILKRPAVVGIHVISSNTGLSLIGNEVEDVWSNVSAICSVVYVRSSPNTVTVSGTQLTRGTKTATRVNNEGIRCNSSSTQIDGGGNQWANAVTAVVSGSTAFQASVLGVPPVPRALPIVTPTNPGVAYSQVEAAAMKTAVDAIRLALKNFGITQ